jgi:hypothetical protein
MQHRPEPLGVRENHRLSSAVLRLAGKDVQAVIP